MEKGSSSTAYGSGDSLNGLKFGKKIYFEDAGGSGSSSAKSMPAKKGKGTLSSSAPAGQKAPRCQVEGCNLDLTGVKPYYCRHKVCGMHSKSPRVIVAGLEQRFCQQCSRFHLLSEFDQGKRSCRRRLAGHNERRRKPPPGPLTSRYGRLSSFHEDNKYRSFLMDFSYPRPAPGASSRDASWPSNNQWHGPAAAFDARVGMTMTNHYATNDTIFPVDEQAPGDCLGGVSDSNCALSLLSTQPWGSAAIAAAAPHRSHGPSLMAQLNMANTCMNNNNSNNNNNTSSWAFRDSSALGIGGLRRLTDAGTNGHFSSELGLALQGNSRQCPDDLSHHEVYGNDQSLMHWSL